MIVGYYDRQTNICEVVSLKWIEMANTQSVLNALINATSITIYLEKKMTRKMNKPEWCGNKDLCGWWLTPFAAECKNCRYYVQIPRILNPDVAEFVESLNRSLGKCGN